MKINNFHIPQELKHFSSKHEDVNIIVGKNGSGKSFLISEIAEYYKREGMQVIGIANSVHDKFINDPRIFLIRDRQGRSRAIKTIKSAFVQHGDDMISKLKSASEALGYVGYDPVIGIKPILSRIHEAYDEVYRLKNQIEIFDMIQSLLDSIKYKKTKDGIHWISMVDFSFEEISSSIYSKLIYLEPELKDNGILIRNELFLSKNNKSIPLLDASSGELNLITSIVFLSMVIERNSVILIDEPENSLHPQWQRNYIKIILDLFHRYRPKIIVSTHSPLIVNGAELYSESIEVYQAKDFSLTLKEKESLNIEETYFEFFDTITPENRFLSNYLVEILNNTMTKKMTIDDFDTMINKVQQGIYIESQKEFLNAFKELATKILKKYD